MKIVSFKFLFYRCITFAEKDFSEKVAFMKNLNAV